jgi:hypothetical protein
MEAPSVVPYAFGDHLALLAALACREAPTGNDLQAEHLCTHRFVARRSSLQGNTQRALDASHRGPTNPSHALATRNLT